jgi:uncharacterized protein YkwD
MKFEVSRRSFLTQASLSLLAIEAATSRQASAALSKLFDDGGLEPMREELLNLVNDERGDSGLGILKLDDLACKVAQKHATDMAENDFLSHWGRDGLKPYHRYAFAGGTDATAENDSAADYSSTIYADELPFAVVRMHKRMFGEVPPNDGHRQTILTPQHTHVGFGMAWRGLHIRLCEIFVARYVGIDPLPTVTRPQSRFLLSGTVLDLNYSVEGVDVYYEPLPSPPARSWLERPLPYSLPEDRTSLYLKLPALKTYDDGTTGTIETFSRGRFRVPIELNKRQPGIYTLVVWISRSRSEQPFPATHVCIRAE